MTNGDEQIKAGIEVVDHEPESEPITPDPE